MGYFVKNRQLQSGSSGVILPTGSTIQRPNNPVFGLIRYNTDTGLIEYFNGTIFQSLSAAGGITYTVDTFTGNGVQTIFSMTQAETTAADIIVFVGSIYQEPTVAYTVNGTIDITFTSAPPNGVPINILHTNS